jgi:hypothetical protein
MREQVVDFEQAALGRHDQGALDQVLQFADVAGVVVVQKRLDGGLREAGDLPAVLAAAGRVAALAA